MGDPSEEMVLRAAEAVERDRTKPYEWTEEQFQVWFHQDHSFVGRKTSWGSNFTGTPKGKLIHECRIALKAALSDDKPTD
jgi:hypothetical protein